MSQFVKHFFGKAITFRYAPAAGGEPHTAYSLTSARLYEDFPTDAQRADTAAGHVEEVATWTLVNREGTGHDEYEIVFADLEDPDPTSSTDYEKYFVALNYLNEASGAAVQDVEQIFVYRPLGATSKIRVSAEDVYELDGALEAVAPTREFVEQKCTAAINYCIGRLKARGYDPRYLFNLEELNGAAARYALSYCCFALVVDGDSSWLEKGRLWREEADLMFDAAAVGYDKDQGGTPEESETVQKGGAVAPLR